MVKNRYGVKPDGMESALANGRSWLVEEPAVR